MWTCLKFLFLIEVNVEVLGAGIDWCSKDLECKGVKNTMCTYSPQKSIADCSDIQDNQTPEGRKKMLELHNAYRNKLAGGGMSGWPKAANMRQMSWDCDIEYVALRWTKQCKSGHDKCRSTPKFSYVGQNYATQGSTANFPPSNVGAFKGWADDEIGLISNPTSMLDSYQGGNWGHFTQAVWAESYKLGCGEIHTQQGKFKTVVTVCNYGPGGNILTTKMYLQGEPASKCPTGTGRSQKYPNLCTEVKKLRYYDATNGTEPEFDCRGSATRMLQQHILVIIAVCLFLN